MMIATSDPKSRKILKERRNRLELTMKLIYSDEQLILIKNVKLVFASTNVLYVLNRSNSLFDITTWLGTVSKYCWINALLSA